MDEKVMTETDKTDRCMSCYRIWGPDVYRFDSSDICTQCQRDNSPARQRSEEYDRYHRDRRSR